MKFGDYIIKPIAIHLTDDDKWVRQRAEAAKRFADSGLCDTHWVNGVHAFKWGIKGTHIFLLDGRPEEKFYVGDANVGNFITQYIAYCVMESMDYCHFMYLEGDCVFEPDWKEKLTIALEDIPKDFDLLYVGNCCVESRLGAKVSNRVGLYRFSVSYPLCTHCWIIAKKALPVLIATQRDVANPTDVSIATFACPHLNVYGLYPRLAHQLNTTLTP